MVMDPHQVQCIAFFAMKDTCSIDGETSFCCDAVLKRENGMAAFLYVQRVGKTLSLLLDWAEQLVVAEVVAEEIVALTVNSSFGIRGGGCFAGCESSVPVMLLIVGG